MGFDTETQTQIPTVFPNGIRKYLDRACSDFEMSRSQFIRKSVKENLREYAIKMGEIDFLNELLQEDEKEKSKDKKTVPV